MKKNIPLFFRMWFVQVYEDILDLIMIYADDPHSRTWATTGAGMASSISIGDFLINKMYILNIWPLLNTQSQLSSGTATTHTQNGTVPWPWHRELHRRRAEAEARAADNREWRSQPAAVAVYSLQQGTQAVACPICWYTLKKQKFKISSLRNRTSKNVRIVWHFLEFGIHFFSTWALPSWKRLVGWFFV